MSASTTVRGTLPSSDGDSVKALVRDHDWSASPLGPVARWPQSLRTVVDLLLSSRFSMWMAWGPELTFFYNEAYRRDTLGVKHQWALGRPFREVWSEIWLDLEQRIGTVLETVEATWDEALLLFLERSGYREETYHTFSYSPLRDDAGRIAGLLSVVAEVTEQVIGERRLALLRDLAARLSTATGEEAVLRAVQSALSADGRDLPFTATYLFDEDGSRARLACVTGLTAAQPAAPPTIEVGVSNAPWPAEAMRAAQEILVLDDLGERLAGLPTGAWDRPPSRAAVVPIAQSGQEAAVGFLVVGLNPFRVFDAAYGGFLGLIAGQIAASLANARAFEEQRKRAAALAELDRAKTTFFSNVSHELRTPLTLLLGPLEDALQTPALPRALHDGLELARRNALRLLKLVNSLLDFARIEAGRVRAHYEPTDLAAFTAELASSFRSACERAGLTLTVDAPPLPQPVFLDHDTWEKVVLNLLSNAFKHTFVGGITVRIERRDGDAALVVEDTGVGISAEELPRVFERFHRVPNARSRTHEGTGIGLALVQEIVRRHGGRIDVESEEGRGTRFTVTLPFGDAHLPRDQVGGAAADRAAVSTATGAAAFVEEALRWLPAPGDDAALGGAAATTSRGAVTAPPAARGTASAADPAPYVLLAEDNADMRDYVGRLLRAQGWVVDAAPDGRTALEYARHRRPDLVLSDVMMPGLDGFALLRALRSEAETATVPVILLSARAGEEARVEGANARADDYLVKPFAAQELVARVGAHLSLARARAEATAAVAAARDLLTRVLEQAPVGICVLRGPEHVYELANAYYRRFLPPGRPIVGRTVREVVPEAEAQGFIGLLDGVRDSGVPWIGRGVEIVYDRHGTGTPESAFLNLLYHPFHGLDGTIDGVIAVVSEVTEEVLARRDAESARRDAEEARALAEAANRAKSDFLAVMSHELRTPLNAIGGYTELLRIGIHGPVTEAQLDALARVDRSQRHLLRLINDVLNLTRIETGRVEYRLTDVSLDVLLADLQPMIEPQLSAKGLAYAVRPPEPGVTVRADQEKLTQVLLNLLSNAIKFTHPGGRISVSVDAGAGRSEDGAARMVAIRVQDTGIGIPAGKREAIFEPFVQVHAGPTRTTDGAGLGLAISRDLARGMGGDLTVDSVEGEGSTFILSLRASGEDTESRQR
jgi:signal transduction histidine kinase/CheY-like chemotaxis protein